MLSPIEQLVEYETYHQKRITCLLHLLGIVLLITSTMIVASWIQLGIRHWFQFGLDWIIALTLSLYYLKLDRDIAIITGILFVILNLGVHFITLGTPTWTGLKYALTAGITALLCFLVGNYAEQKRIAITDDLKLIYIMPAYLITKIAFTMQFKKALKEKMIASEKDNLFETF